MKSKFLVISTGFALFSMFFGSGNLVFPLAVGQESHGHVLWATLGICLTGVLVPLLGTLGILLFEGDSRRFFGAIGKPATFWLPLITLGLLGPFGVVARCITVAFGSFHLFFPNASLTIFSIVSCILIYFVSINKNRIIPLLGTILTPILIASLTAIALLGIWYGNSLEYDPTHTWKAFRNGFFQGYQTMDLLAAFFFSSFILKHIKDNSQTMEKSTIWKVFVQSALIGGGLLSIFYLALVYLGSTFSSELLNTPPEAMLGAIALKIGGASAAIVCLAIILACYTTAVVLASLFADFIKTDIARNKISDKMSIIITLLIAFGVSTLEFSGIARILKPILDAIYPALIVLTLMNIATQLWGIKSRRWPVFVTFVAKLGLF